MRFTDRRDAGIKLAELLVKKGYHDPVVLALPRGGVPVAAELARALGAPLDLLFVRKIGAPDNEEFALGAIAEGEPPELVLDRASRDVLSVPQRYLDETITAGLREIARRRSTYLGQKPPVPVAGRTAILVDDGIATGATMLAALRATRRRQPARLVLAVPVAASDTLRRLASEADDMICVQASDMLGSVGEFYYDFSQLRDEDVISILTQANAQPGASHHNKTP
ncbi:MAG TPA: phosphoribosyltransferase family protein [Acidocella sp.]|jgi:putative phosphoribosyl transferase|nr:phosphoribosyltransferase family protein [Acidocella sp.]